MVLSSSTIRPGYLVSLKTQVQGNVKYDKQVIESEYLTTDGKQKARWETERTIHDPVEHEAAIKAQGKARGIICGVCAKSAFGLLCPEDRGDKLEAAIAEARKVAEEFNLTAKLSRLSVYVITGKVAQSDAEAIRAINSEVADLLRNMESGVKNLDVGVIREAANKAKNIGAMLTDSAKENIQVAIDAARTAARRIVKAGEEAAGEVDTATMRKIAAQRTMFLDLDDSDVSVATPQTEARNIEMVPLDDMPMAPVKVTRVPRLELD